MKSDIKYYWGNDHLLIDLGNRIESRIRFVYWIEFLITTGIATIFLLRSFNLSQSGLVITATAGVVLIYLLAAYRFLSRMFYREKIGVSDHHFTIIRQTPFGRRLYNYEWKKMGALHYKGKDAKTDHPLKGKCFDYFGFDTQERVVQDLHHDGNLYFEYEGKPIRFARGIFSWHAEDLVRMVHLFPGSALQLGEEWKYLLEEIDWTKES